MPVSRRQFLKYCGLAAAGAGLDRFDLGLLRTALASPTAPSVIWLQGSACSGCSISFLNRISDTAPMTADEVLTQSINLVYHPTLMAQAGESAAASLEQVRQGGAYVLVVEGGVPTAFGGHPCLAYTLEGREVTFQQAVQDYAARAAAIVCAGTCASWGGIPASGPNLTGVYGVKALTGRTTINISGCPANPDWLVWAIVQLLLQRAVPLDAAGRPTGLYQAAGVIHDHCPRNQGGFNRATDFGQDGQCLINLGCRGPATQAPCIKCWNGKANAGHWCVGVNAPCHGCVEPTFPGPQAFYVPYA